MKKIFHFLIITFFTNLGFSQENNFIGIYKKEIHAKTGEVLKYTLELKSDQTFSFHFFRNIGQKISVDENLYSEGNWEIKNNIIYFTNQNITPKPLQINFNETTGRLDHKDKNLFRFYRSNTFWLKGLTLKKIN